MKMPRKGSMTSLMRRFEAGLNPYGIRCDLTFAVGLYVSREFLSLLRDSRNQSAS